MMVKAFAVSGWVTVTLPLLNSVFRKGAGNACNTLLNPYVWIVRAWFRRNCSPRLPTLPSLVAPALTAVIDFDNSCG